MSPKLFIKALKLTVTGVLVLLTVTGFAVRILSSSFWTALETGRHHTEKSVGLSNERVQKINDDVVVFLNGGSLNETTAGIFTREEKDHLNDVRNVFRTLFISRDISAAALAFWGLIALVGRRKWWKAYLKWLTYSGFAILAIMILIAMAAFIDFDLFFERFHEVLFKPGTWTFASTSMLIRLYPEAFWIDSLIGLVIIVTVFVLVMILVSSYLRIFER